MNSAKTVNDMDKIARLRKEIERLKGMCTAQIKANHGQTFPFVMEMTGYDKLLSFLDTLTEENALPCWKKVHTYTEELREGDMEKMLLDLSIGKGKRKTKIALPDRVVDTLSEEPDKSLEEAAEISFDEAKSLTEDYRDFLAKGLTENQPRPIGPHWFCEYAKNRFITGAEWQKEQFEKNYKEIFNDYWTRGFEEGRADMKEQMLKDAVEGTVMDFSSYLPRPQVDIRLDPHKYHTGDKVRIVVLKEEE